MLSKSDIQNKMEDNSKDHVFNVHFENRNVAFANGFARMFNEENQFDVTISVEGKELKAHRHILSFISKEFENQFEDKETFELISGELFKCSLIKLLIS